MFGCCDLIWLIELLARRVGQEQAHKAAANEQTRHDERRRGTVFVQQRGDHNVANDAAQTSGHHGDGHTGGPELCGEYFGDEAVKRRIGRGDGATEDGWDDQVLNGAAHKVHEGRADAGGHGAGNEEELASHHVHAENGQQIGGQGRGQRDERFHEHRFRYMRGAGAIPALLLGEVHHIFGDGTDAGGLVGEGLLVRLEAIEQLREPHQQAVVANVECKVDRDRDDGEAQDGRLEQGATVVHHAADHARVLILHARRALQQLLVHLQVVDHVLVGATLRVRHEDATEDGQGTILLAARQQELGRLRQIEEQEADQERGQRAYQQEDAPRVVREVVRNEANACRDDQPGQTGHEQVAKCPEGGHEAQHGAALSLRLELGEVRPDHRTATAQTEGKREDCIKEKVSGYLNKRVLGVLKIL